MRNLITDIDGILVGQSEIVNDNNRSGVTLIVPEQPCVASYMLRGGAPASRDLHLLEPEKLVTNIDAICLSGGSAYGLAAADALMKILHQQEKGFATDAHRVPIIPSASLFDLRLNQTLPDYSVLAEQAFHNLSKEFSLGNVGAGTGAVSGNLKGGIGSASTILPNHPDIKIGALVALNSFGSSIINHQGELYGANFLKPEDDPQQIYKHIQQKHTASEQMPFCKAGFQNQNTSLAIIATNMSLNKAELKALANGASDGLARAIYPCHTLYDGDVCFALSTSQMKTSDMTTTQRATDNKNHSLLLVQLTALAAHCVTRAVMRAILEAQSIPSHPNYRDFLKSNLK